MTLPGAHCSWWTGLPNRRKRTCGSDFHMIFCVSQVLIYFSNDILSKQRQEKYISVWCGDDTGDSISPQHDSACGRSGALGLVFLVLLLPAILSSVVSYTIIPGFFSSLVSTW